jgi:hypothetical protein
MNIAINNTTVYDVLKERNQKLNSLRTQLSELEKNLNAVKDDVSNYYAGVHGKINDLIIPLFERVSEATNNMLREKLYKEARADYPFKFFLGKLFGQYDKFIPEYFSVYSLLGLTTNDIEVPSREQVKYCVHINFAVYEIDCPLHTRLYNLKQFIRYVNDMLGFAISFDTVEHIDKLYQYDVKQKLILKDISDVNDKIKIIEKQISEFSIDYFMDSPCSVTYDVNQCHIKGK